MPEILKKELVMTIGRGERAMALKIVRNDITKMNTEAIVNTANEKPVVGPGVDTAVYKAAGYDELLKYRKEEIGSVPEGEVFITPGFGLAARYIIHAVSPLYQDGCSGEELKLRSCYRKSLRLAKSKGIRSIAFPLISTGSFGYPKEEGMLIAVDEINAFLLGSEMEIYLVVFDDKASSLGGKLYPGLEEYIDRHYVERRVREEYDEGFSSPRASAARPSFRAEREFNAPQKARGEKKEKDSFFSVFRRRRQEPDEDNAAGGSFAANMPMPKADDDYAAAGSFTANAPMAGSSFDYQDEDEYLDFSSQHESRLQERMSHMSDTFSQYLLYLIESKHMTNAEVYKRAIVDKKIFSKLKNNVNYHPQKLTALCLCVGAKLNLDESKDLLARAGYALSPCDKTDIIFSYFIENEIYDMIELDIQLEEHDLPCIIA